MNDELEKKDVVFPNDSELDKLSRMSSQGEQSKSAHLSNNPLSDSYTWYSLVLMLLFIVFVVLAFSGFGWAGYSILFYFIVIYAESIRKKRVAFGSPKFTGSTIITGKRAVVFSVFIIVALLTIFLLVTTNLMLIFTALVPKIGFEFKGNYFNLGIGIIIGTISGYFGSKLEDATIYIKTHQFGAKVIKT